MKSILNVPLGTINSTKIDTKLIAVYGSLRKYGWLHESWIPSSSKNFGNFVLPGFELYPITPNFPAVCKTENKDSKVIFDVFEVNEHQERALSEMEMRANYSPTTITINIEGKDTEVITYLMNKEIMVKEWGMDESTKPIEDGDWINFYKK